VTNHLDHAATLPASVPSPPAVYEDLGDLLDLISGDEKHSSASTSTLDVLWVLYDRVLQVRPESLDDPNRDRFILSKGHGPAAYYAILAAKGFFSPSLLPGFGTFASPLGHHPDRLLIPGVEVSSGSLGHGLAIAVGIALGLRIQRRSKPRVVCLLGDGELEEGSNHEALWLAALQQLSALTVIVVDNRSSGLGWPTGVGAPFAAAGWMVEQVDGHDRKELERALRRRFAGVPNLVVATTEPRS
jgi:transketolase